jgi:Sulfotransferase family
LPFPNFLGIGAQKAGTTWLAANLSHHPDIWMPPLKELHYFDQRIKEPSHGALLARLLGKRYTDDWYHRFWLGQLKYRIEGQREKFDLGQAMWDIRFFTRSPSDRWYASLFREARGRVAGEVTPAYSVLDEESIAYVHSLMPDAKLIFLMRNPIERAYSGAVMHLDLEGQKSQTASDEELSKLAGRIGVERTRYLRILERWRQYYPDEQIFVGFLEDIHFYPIPLMRRLCRFLGVDTSYAEMAIKRKIHTRSREKIPVPLAVQLASTYYDDLQDLSARFGGYASFWLYAAERLMDGALGDDAIVYPLWDSQLWEEWTSDSAWEGRAQSGPLPSVGVR